MTDLDAFRTAILAAADQTVAHLETNLDCVLTAYRQVARKSGRTNAIGWIVTAAPLILDHDLTVRLLAVALARLDEQPAIDPGREQETYDPPLPDTHGWAPGKPLGRTYPDQTKEV